MRRFSLVVITGLLFSLSASLCSADNFPFRKAKWGMSLAEVKASEPLKVAEESEDFLAYKTSVIGKDVFVIYSFTENQLTLAKYVLADSHSNKNDFITDYNDFNDILTKKYGSPPEQETFWRNDLFKDDYSSWGTAISIGHLSYFSTWITKDTNITNYLIGENYKITCAIEYASVELEKLRKKAKERKALEEF